MSELGTAQRKWMKYLLIPLVFASFVLLWDSIVILRDISSFVLPRPGAVWNQLVSLGREGILWDHTIITVKEAGLGFAFGFVFANVVGYILGKSEMLEQLFSPYLVAIQAVPIIGIAPLLIIWFGFGFKSTVIICFIVVFFPMLVSAIVAVRTVQPADIELMRSYSASRWMVFRQLELPASLPVVLAGIKTSIVRAMMGAMVGEYIGGTEGLGYLLIIGGIEFFDTSMVLAATVALVALTILGYLFALTLEILLLPSWRRHVRE
ncbi:MAG: ABC transporter permease [Chloroflexi bacterium]|nr:ABC transporter permease [Chloroflexota bacterium]